MTCSGEQWEGSLCLSQRLHSLSGVGSRCLFKSIPVHYDGKRNHLFGSTDRSFLRFSCWHLLCPLALDPEMVLDQIRITYPRWRRCCVFWPERSAWWICWFFPYLFLSYVVAIQNFLSGRLKAQWGWMAVGNQTSLLTLLIVELELLRKDHCWLEQTTSPRRGNILPSEMCALCTRSAGWPWRKLLLGLPSCSGCKFNLLFIFLASGYLGIRAKRSHLSCSR